MRLSTNVYRAPPSDTQKNHPCSRNARRVTPGTEAAASFSMQLLGTRRQSQPDIFNDTYKIAREAWINAFEHSAAGKIELRIPQHALLLIVTTSVRE